MNHSLKQRHSMTLRLSPTIAQRLKIIADANKRSLTKEIEAALEEYLKANEAKPQG